MPLIVSLHSMPLPHNSSVLGSHIRSQDFPERNRSLGNMYLCHTIHVAHVQYIVLRMGPIYCTDKAKHTQDSQLAPKLSARRSAEHVLRHGPGHIWHTGPGLLSALQLHQRQRDLRTLLRARITNRTDNRLGKNKRYCPFGM